MSLTFLHDYDADAIIGYGNAIVIRFLNSVIVHYKVFYWVATKYITGPENALKIPL